MIPLNDRRHVIIEILENFKGYWKGIILKLVAIIIVMLMTVSFFTAGAQYLQEAIDDKNKINCISSLEHDYYEGEYVDILDTLYLYDAYEEKYNKYWEIGRAYENFSLYKMWQKALTDIDDNDSFYKEKRDYYAGQVLKAYEGCSDKENKLIMDGFVQAISK